MFEEQFAFSLFYIRWHFDFYPFFDRFFSINRFIHPSTAHSRSMFFV